MGLKFYQSDQDIALGSKRKKISGGREKGTQLKRRLEEVPFLSPITNAKKEIDKT